MEKNKKGYNDPGAYTIVLSWSISTLGFLALLTGFPVSGFSKIGDWRLENPKITPAGLYGIVTLGPDTMITISNCNELLRTTDGGASWDTSAVSNPSVPDYDQFRGMAGLDFVNPKVGWIWGASADFYPLLMKTSDGGITWRTDTLPGPLGGFSSSVEAADFLDDRLGWVIMGYGSSPNTYFLLTRDGGNTWSVIHDTTWNTAYQGSQTKGIQFVSSRIGFAWNQDTVYTTTDSGYSWVSHWAASSKYVNDGYFVDAMNGWLCEDSGRVDRTTDGGNSWTTELTGTNSRLRTIFFRDSSTGWVAGDRGIILETTDGGTTWTEESIPSIGGISTIKMAIGSLGWAVGDYGTILRTTDGGSTWDDLDPGFRQTLYDVDFINHDIGWTAGDSGIVERTTDGGKTWSGTNVGSSTALFKLDFINSGTGWVGGSNGFVARTTDGGQSWQKESMGTSHSIGNLFFLNKDVGYALAPPFVLR